MQHEDFLIPGSPSRELLREALLADDYKVLAELLPIAELSASELTQTKGLAARWLVALRGEADSSVAAFLNAYPLSSEEGTALLRLAEGLLRIPDAQTQDRLIAENLVNKNWRHHGRATRRGLVFVGAALALVAGLVKSLERGGVKARFARLCSPLIRGGAHMAMTRFGEHFVMAGDIDAALSKAAIGEAKGYRYSFDMLGEGARTAADAQRYFAAYEQAVAAIGAAGTATGAIAVPGISVKMSAIHPRYEFSQRQRVLDELLPKLQKLTRAAKHWDIGLTIDAEESDRLEVSLAVVEAVLSDAELAGWSGFGVAVQAYQKRAPRLIDWLIDLAQRCDRQLCIRLVKGAYWDGEIKAAQMTGMADYPVFTRKPATDVCYLACARKLLAQRRFIYPQFATHNAYTVAAIMAMSSDTDGFEFQRLYGMGEALYRQALAGGGVPCRVYAPVGPPRELLAYLVRRLLENGATSSFVNSVANPHIGDATLLADPVASIIETTEYRHPRLLMPTAIYPGRPSAVGFSLADINSLRTVQLGVANYLRTVTAATKKHEDNEEYHRVHNPAKPSQCLGVYAFDSTVEVADKLAAANSVFTSWSQTDVTVRVALLQRFADELESHRDELIALCIAEAGKTLADSLAELREAIDFCRYYAMQLQSMAGALAGYQARGVVLAISPWNFPLAIFVGQVVAALAAGNAVLAKPAQQTSLMASKIVDIFNRCGLPRGVLSLLLGSGPTLAAQLLPDSRIAAVVFTGSLATAKQLQYQLAKYADGPLPLIAETGGVNVMIADSTALPEQLVDDVLRSAFQSAGQRCSALRLLYVQEDIADRVTAMLIGAMDELRLGDPMQLNTDVGPVIDEAALARLHRHHQRMHERGAVLHQCQVVDENLNGWFFPPTLYELPSLSELAEEVFGPCLHIVRFRADELDSLVMQINASGYGLTLGVHSRLQQRAESLAARLNIGNIYINRDIIGAVVGVQPFGGRGLSGTGPKAGGPHYLWRFLSAIPSITTLGDCIAVADGGREYLSDQACSLLNTVKQQMVSKVLPGPTGESNTLSYQPRGRLCMFYSQDDDLGHCLHSVSLTAATGNSLLAYVPESWLPDIQRLLAALRGAGIELESRFEVFAPPRLAAYLHEGKADAVLLSPHSDLGVEIGQLLAAEPGPIVPVICEYPSAVYWQRLVVEKTTTVNTVAGGGNCALMMLGAS